MYCSFPLNFDESVPEFPAETGDWFSVEGDLDDFIFFDPAGISSEASSK